MSKEAMKLALDALEVATTPLANDRQEVLRAQAALREALAQPEQQPVASIYITPDGAREFDDWKCELPVGSNILYTTPQPPASRLPLTDEQITLFINGRGDEGDDDYVEPTGDGFGLTDADLVKLVRRVEAHYGIKENT